jgi:glycosyltransferase involved in cell wall biosynthesis
LVNEWIKDGLLPIRYIYKENGGKYTAMRMANEVCSTKYLITLDSDDELIPTALEVINKQWEAIEAASLGNSIAEIRAYSMYPDGNILGNYRLPDSIEFIDTTWQEMVLKNRNDNELFCSWNLEKLKLIMNFDEDFWLKGKFKYLGEGIYWARLGKQFKTRYLNISLRIYHVDAGISIMRGPRQEVFFYDAIVGSKYFLDENIEYFFWRPKYFFNLLIKYGVSKFILNISFAESLRVIQSKRFRLYYILSYPAAFFLYLYYRKIKKSYW